MDPLINQVHASISAQNLIPTGSTIIVGLSGGPDSVFLLYALLPLHKQGVCKVIAAHLDHEWRPDSSLDAQFCKDLAENLAIPFAMKKITDLPFKVKFNGSKEEVGRLMRRHFFQTAKQEFNADRIALAHHADDQQETFFMRLLRGSSLTGLTCMKLQAGDYIRPLLSVSKKEIIDYLHNHGIAYRKDPSNESDLFLRNRLRHSVLPALHKADARFDKNFAHTLSRLQDTEQFLEQLTQDTFAQLQVSSEQNSINLSHFLTLHPFMQTRVLMKFLCDSRVSFPVSEAFLREIMRFLHNPGHGTHQIHPHWQLKKIHGMMSVETLI